MSDPLSELGGSIHQIQGSQADTSGQNSRAEKNLSKKLQAFRKSKAKTESEVGALREGVLGVHPLLTPHSRVQGL